MIVPTRSHGGLEQRLGGQAAAPSLFVARGKKFLFHPLPSKKVTRVATPDVVDRTSS